MKKLLAILILIAPIFALDIGEIIGGKLSYGPVTNITGPSTNLVTNVVTGVYVGTVGETSYMRAYDNSYDISFTGVLALSLLGSGPGGLDTGTLSTNALYAVYVIADSHRKNRSNTTLIISTNLVTPFLPTNAAGLKYAWNIYRRVGAVRTYSTNAAHTNVIPFFQVGNGRSRTMTYLGGSPYTSVAVAALGTNTTFMSASLASLVPVDCEVSLAVGYFQGGTNGLGGIHLRSKSSDFVDDNGSYRFSLGVSGTGPDNIARGVVLMPCANRAILYRVFAVENVASFNVAAYRDEL